MTDFMMSHVKTREDVNRMVVDILHDMFELPTEKLVGSANLYTDLDIDSIDAVDLVVKLNEMTGRRLQPDAFKSIRTIDDIVNALIKLLLEDKA